MSLVPKVSFDYGFLGAKSRIEAERADSEGQSPILVMHDAKTRSIFGHLVPAKGVEHEAEKVEHVKL